MKTKGKRGFCFVLLLFLFMGLAGGLFAQAPSLTETEQKDLKILQLQQQVLSYQAQELQTALAQYNARRKELEESEKDFTSETLKAHKLDPKKYTVNIQTGAIVPIPQPSKPETQKKATK